MTASKLLNSTIRNQVYLEGLKSEEVNQFAAFLRQIDRDLRQRLTADDLTQMSRTRLEKLLREVKRSLNGIFSEYYDELAGHLTDLATYESEFEAKNLANAIDSPDFESVIPAPEQVRAAVFSSPLSVRGADGGKLLEPFVKDWIASDVKRLTGAIRQGFFEGQTNFQILQSLRGTKSLGYKDGVIATVDRHAKAIVRTAVQHTASTARMETWKQNDIEEYQVVATLDGRTSAICRSLDKKVFEIDKGPVPPFHIQCRSTTVAKLPSKYDVLDKGATRASKDGPVDAGLNYYEWLQTQDPDFQDDVLGPVRGKLFRDGNLSPNRFASLQLDKNFKSLTLDDMRRKEPNAFNLVGNDDFTSEENARDYVVNNGKRFGGEFAWAGDPDSGEFLFKKRGQKSSVSFSSREIEQLEKKPDAVLYHNHPSGSSLSFADLRFVAHTNIKEIVAFATHDKGEYRASINFELLELNRAHRETEAFVRQGLQKLVNSLDLTPDEAGLIHTHAINTLLDRQGAINYKAVEFGAKMKRAHEKLSRHWSGWENVYSD